MQGLYTYSGVLVYTAITHLEMTWEKLSKYMFHTITNYFYLATANVAKKIKFHQNNDESHSAKINPYGLHK